MDSKELLSIQTTFAEVDTSAAGAVGSAGQVGRFVTQHRTGKKHGTAEKVFSVEASYLPQEGLH